MEHWPEVEVTWREKLAALGFDSYKDYVYSSQWAEMRNRYQEATERPQCCVVCGKEKVVLHHMTYARLGNEDLGDLLPLCRGHHWRLHEELERHGLPVEATLRIIPCMKGAWERGKEMREATKRKRKKGLPVMNRNPSIFFAALLRDFGREAPKLKEVYPHPEYQRLATLCFCLAQHCNDEGRFFIAQQDAGRFLEISGTTVGRYLGRLEQAGVIERVQSGDRFKKRANRYRWLPATGNP